MNALKRTVRSASHGEKAWAADGRPHRALRCAQHTLRVIEQRATAQTWTVRDDAFHRRIEWTDVNGQRITPVPASDEDRNAQLG